MTSEWDDHYLLNIERSLTPTDASTAGKEQTKVMTLKQPHSDASRMERINTFCRSTDPYTFARSFLGLRPSLPFPRQTSDDFVAVICDSESCIFDPASTSFSVAPDLLFILTVP